MPSDTQYRGMLKSSLCPRLLFQEKTTNNWGFQLAKRMVWWKLTDRWDDENNWLLEERTALIFKGGNRKNPANYRPLTSLSAITIMVKLATKRR